MNNLDKETVMIKDAVDMGVIIAVTVIVAVSAMIFVMVYDPGSASADSAPTAEEFEGSFPIGLHDIPVGTQE